MPQKRGYLYRAGRNPLDRRPLPSPSMPKRAARFSAAEPAWWFCAVSRTRSADGDQILAVIKGSAIKNDGSDKVGYLAPSVEGQAKADHRGSVDQRRRSRDDFLRRGAWNRHHRRRSDRGCGADSRVPPVHPRRTSFLRDRLLKSNIGHLGEAAGVAAFIKTVLALNTGRSRRVCISSHRIPRSISPTALSSSTRSSRPGPPRRPRRAGITSLGAGGTNCHVIVEEPPVRTAPGPSRRLAASCCFRPNAVGARNRHGQSRHSSRRSIRSSTWPTSPSLFTSAARGFRIDCALVCREPRRSHRACEAKSALSSPQGQPADRPVVFLFPGQGAAVSEHGARSLCFRTCLPARGRPCAEILKQPCGMDLREVIFPTAPRDGVREQLNQTAVDAAGAVSDRVRPREVVDELGRAAAAR